MKPGDIVLHKPSGEKWRVAAVRHDMLSAEGWPETWAQLHDCELLKSCSMSECLQTIRCWAKKRGNPECYADMRVLTNFAFTEEIDEAACNQMMRV